MILCKSLNLTPDQLLWEAPNPIVNQWEHVFLFREGVKTRPAVKPKQLQAKIKKLMERAMTKGVS